MHGATNARRCWTLGLGAFALLHFADETFGERKIVSTRMVNTGMAAPPMTPIDTATVGMPLSGKHANFQASVGGKLVRSTSSSTRARHCERRGHHVQLEFRIRLRQIRRHHRRTVRFRGGSDP